jgi:hypothetical protein
MFIDPNRGQAKDRSKAGRYRTADRLRVRAARIVKTGELGNRT